MKINKWNTTALTIGGMIVKKHPIIGGVMVLGSAATILFPEKVNKVAFSVVAASMGLSNGGEPEDMKEEPINKEPTNAS